MKRMSLALAAGAVTLLGYQTVAKAPRPAAPAAAAPMTPVRNPLGSGYLAAPLADQELLSPPPPGPGSPAEARDVAGADAALAVRDSPRWALATSDADLFSPNATSTFSCAAGFAVGPQATPKLDALLRKTARDLSGATAVTKDRYKRARPFMVNGQPICTPEADRSLRGNGSYPSGHSAIGYGWGLILAELVPDRAARLVARGRAFGDSRRICNVHWLSDIEEGRIAAAAAVARLHAEPAFRADMDAARAELGQPHPAAGDCAREEAALAG